MPCGPRFPDRLPEIDLVQKRNHPFPEQCRHSERDQRRSRKPKRIHTLFFHPFADFSFAYPDHFSIRKRHGHSFPGPFSALENFRKRNTRRRGCRRGCKGRFHVFLSVRLQAHSADDADADDLKCGHAIGKRSDVARGEIRTVPLCGIGDDTLETVGFLPYPAEISCTQTGKSFGSGHAGKSAASRTDALSPRSMTSLAGRDGEDTAASAVHENLLQKICCPLEAVRYGNDLFGSASYPPYNRLSL